jgi:hypothetical protein
VICEHWTGDGDMLLPAGRYADEKDAWMFEGMVQCCTIEAATWDEAMSKYYEHMGWGTYRPMSQLASE